eukprot:TRINITY_DN2155_c1_g1_i1.p2 TRINITY_DN2155_c1_g1~~TRINITY_DN2155_c1_g1_i1.p2  ORF type:complete len:206 (-),score=-21.93 TRINITY_DN2155_c1_g1_i1:912-1529(-)
MGTHSKLVFDKLIMLVLKQNQRNQKLLQKLITHQLNQNAFLYFEPKLLISLYQHSLDIIHKNSPHFRIFYPLLSRKNQCSLGEVRKNGGGNTHAILNTITKNAHGCSHTVNMLERLIKINQTKTIVKRQHDNYEVYSVVNLLLKTSQNQKYVHVVIEIFTSQYFYTKHYKVIIAAFRSYIQNQYAVLNNLNESNFKKPPHYFFVI